jgi:hypothetical protein
MDFAASQEMLGAMRSAAEQILYQIPQAKWRNHSSLQGAKREPPAIRRAKNMPVTMNAIE